MLFLLYALHLMFFNLSLFGLYVVVFLILYLSKLVFDFCLSLFRMLTLKKRGERWNSFSCFPFLFFRFGNDKHVVVNHFFTLKNRTYGTSTPKRGKNINHYLIVCFLTFLIVTIISIMCKNGVFVSVSSLLLYNIIIYYNFERLENRAFDGVYYVLFMNKISEKEKDEIIKLSLVQMSLGKLYSDELIYLSYLSIQCFNRGETVDVSLIKKINDYVITQHDVILHVMYLDLIFIQLYCFSKLSLHNSTQELLKILVDYSECVSEDDYFKLVGRLKRNYKRALDNRFDDFETRSMFRSLFID